MGIEEGSQEEIVVQVEVGIAEGIAVVVAAVDIADILGSLAG